MPGAKAEASTGFPDDWFYGGEKRPAWLRAAEGKPLKPIKVEAWIGEPVTPKAMEKRVTVLQFVQTSFGPSLLTLEKLNPVAEKYAKQGVVFMGMCDATGDWERMGSIAESREISYPIALDAPGESDEASRGAMSHTLGLRNGAATVVVDRAGVVRAVGLKPEHLEAVINTLLAERIQSSPSSGGS
jgi:hypothetical protein